MIRSRSTIAPELSSMISASDVERLEPSIRFPGGTRLWRYLIIISGLGILVYTYLIWGSPPFNANVSRSNIDKEYFEKISIVMNTFKRNDMMTDAIDYYSTCGIVKNIFVIWSEKDPPPSDIVTKYSANVQSPKTIFLAQKEDSLNNRFLPISGPHTDAILSVDDDMRIPCSEIILAYDVWRASPRSLVGFMPRIHLRENGKLVYRCWWRVWWHGAYSIILTKAAILHHDYFVSYTNKMPQAVRTLVDKKRNCEDLAMQFLIANESSLPPIYVKGHLDDKGVLGGISTSQNIATASHMNERSHCLNDLVKIYSKNPLVLSHIIVDSGSHSLFSYEPSTWYEFISSDLWNFF